MQKLRCVLPRIFRSMCNTGCIYREPHIAHAKCLRVSHQSPCAGPCLMTEHCECRRKPGGFEIVIETPKKRIVDME